MAKNKGGSGFDDFDIDNLDFDFNDSGIIPDKNDRTPFTKFRKDFYQGVKEQTRTGSFYKNLLRKALPKEYRDALDSIDNATKRTADLYNTSVNKLNPSVRAIKKATRRILPSSDKIIPKELQSKLKDWAESEYYGQGAALSKEEIREAELGLNLGDVFTTQVIESAKQHDDSKRRDVLRSVMENKRHLQTMGSLDSLCNGIGRLVGYQDSITVKYQRKSLELQYRHLYATKDLIDTFNEKSNKNLEALQGIVKNTGLPDAIKLRGTEAFGNIARERFITKVQSSAFGGLDKLVERFTKNAGRMLTDKINSINDIVDQVAGAGEATQGHEGFIAGGLAADGAANLLAGPLGKYLAKNRKLTAFLARTSAFVRNAPGHADALMRSAPTADYSTFKGRLKGSAIDTLKELFANNDKASIGAGDMSESANDPSSFTVLARRSITDVIPGYLARILREVSVLRTGDSSTPLLGYNLKRGKFTSTADIRDNVRDRIRSKESIVTQRKKGVGLLSGPKAEVKTGTKDYVNTIIDKIDPRNRLSPAARDALAKQLLHNSLNDQGFIPKNLANEANYHPSIDGGDRSELASFMKREFRTDRNRKMGERARLDVRINDISGQFTYLAQNVPAIIDEIELILRLPDGREHLEELGFLVFKNGVSTLSYDAVVEFLLGIGGIHATGGTSSSTHSNNSASPTYRYVSSRSNYSWGAYLRSNAKSVKGSNPITIFRNMYGNLYGKKDVYQEQAKNAVKKVGARIRGAAENVKAKYASPEQLAANVKRGQAISDNIQYQAWLAKQAVKDRLSKSEWLARIKSQPGYDATMQSIDNARQLAPNALGDLKAKVSGGAQSSMDVVEGSLINAYTTAESAAGRTPTLKGLRDWMSGARKLVGERISAIELPRFGGSGGGGGIGDGDTRSTGNPGSGSAYESEVLRLLGRSADGIDDLKELLQAGIHIQTNAAGGDGRRYGFRYGLRSGIGKVLSGAGGLLKTGMNAYGYVLKKTTGALGSVISGAGTLAGNILSRVVNRKFSDIYVKGSRNPALFAAGQRQGFYTDVITKKVIKKLSDITGPVVDQDGNQVLSIDDFRKGLYDVQGKPVLRNVFSKAMSFYGMLLAPVAFAAKAAVGVMGFVKDQFTKERDIYVRTDPHPRFPRLRVTIMQTGGYQSVRTKKLIISIKDIDGPVEDRDGNLILSAIDLQHICDSRGRDIKTFGQRIFNAAAGVARLGTSIVTGAAKMAYGAGKGLLNLTKGIGIRGYNFLMKGFGLSGVEAVKLGNSNSTVALLTDIRNILDKRLPGKKTFGDSDGDGDRDNSVADILSRRAKARADRAAAAAGKRGPGLLDGLGAKLKGLFGKDEEKAEGDTNIIGGGLGGGKDAKTPPKKPTSRIGKGWEAIKGKASKIPGAKYLGKAAGMAGSVLKYGGKIAMGVLALSQLGLGGILLSGGAALLSGIVAVVSSPIVLGALAVGAVGAGLYFGYKYLKGTAKTEFRNIRLAQYGIDPANEEQASKTLKLEDAVAKFVSLSGATAALKMTADDVVDVMREWGVDFENEAKIESWVTWFNERFKVIYINHRAACEKIGPGDTIAQMDSKWGNAQKLSALKLLKQPMSYPPYDVYASPFTTPLSGNTTQITEFIAAAEKAFATVKETGKSGVLNSATTSAGMMLGGGKGISGTALQQKDSKVAMNINQMGAKAAATSQFKLKGSVAVSGTANISKAGSSSLTALDCIRFKAYGLVNLDIDKVRTLRDLERGILPDVVFSTKGVASFEGEAEEYLNKYSSMFGISASDTDAVYKWSVWFSTRFIPVLVAYCTAVREQNSTVDILDAFQYLKPDQALSIGQTLISTKTGGFFSSSVWGIPHSPWTDYVLNSDSGTTKGNIDSLTLAVKNRTYADTTAILGAATAASATDKSDNMLMDSGKNGDKGGGFFSTMSNIIIGKKSPPPNMVQKAVEGQDSSGYGNDTYMMPVNGRISSMFGNRSHPIYGEEAEHKGVDIAAPNGTPIRAAADGVITVRGSLRGYGNAVYIRHPDGKSTRYAHMSHFHPGLEVGSSVRKGDIIGYVGNTGGSTGNHLHFEVREDSSYNGKAIDPIKFLGDRQKVAADIKELKGFETGLKKDDAQPAGTPTPSTPVLDSSTKSINDNLDSLVNTAPANSYVGVTAPAAIAAGNTAEDVRTERKKQESIQARTIENRNKAADSLAAEGLSSVVEVLNRSYDVQVEIRNGIMALQSSMSNATTGNDTATGAANPGRRPTTMRSNPVSMRKPGL